MRQCGVSVCVVEDIAIPAQRLSGDKREAGVMSSLKTTEISSFLKSRTRQSSVSAPVESPSCDVVYAIFLESRAEPDPAWGAAERLLHNAVKLFQPAPGLAHCELVIPPIPQDEGLRSQFSTYLGAQSAWQNERYENERFYLIENANHWRAVPVFSENLAAKVRCECDAELGVKYSLLRYVSALPPFRYLSGLMSDTRRAPAHCATLTARVLKNALVGDDTAPVHSSAYYGPTTLYHELNSNAHYRGASIGASSRADMTFETQMVVEKLLRGVMSHKTVSDVGDEGCMSAVRALTMRVCNTLAKGDATSQKLAQQQLATALLRWVVLRQES